MGDRPSSQMSFLEQFLKESSVGRSRDPLNSTASGSISGRPERVSMDSSSAAARRAMSIESDEGDVEDNRAGSITSSRSNMSEVRRSFMYSILHSVEFLSKRCHISRTKSNGKKLE